MAAQHEQAAGAASSERSAASSLFREVAEVVVLAVILYVDIIILRPPTNNSTDFIKRVIALPGEKLLIRSGVVYINGHRLDEPYLPEAWSNDNNYPRNGSDGEVMPANDYFVMGDNRNRSQDSRFFGPISRDRIDGKAWFRIWPLD